MAVTVKLIRAWVHENGSSNGFKRKMDPGTSAGGGSPTIVSTGRDLLCQVQWL